MLTRGQLRIPLRLLFVLQLTGMILNTTAVVMMVIYQYVGLFGISAKTIVCVTTETYFINKFNNVLGIPYAFGSQAIACLISVCLFVILFVVLVKYQKEAGQDEAVYQSFTTLKFGAIYVMLGLSSLGSIIPGGYYLSLIIQVPKGCTSGGFQLMWVIFALLSLVALVLYGICIFVVYRMAMMENAEELKKDEEKEKKQGDGENKVEEKLEEGKNEIQEGKKTELAKQEKHSEKMEKVIKEEEKQAKVPLLEKQNRDIQIQVQPQKLQQKKQSKREFKQKTPKNKQKYPVGQPIIINQIPQPSPQHPPPPLPPQPPQPLYPIEQKPVTASEPLQNNTNIHFHFNPNGLSQMTTIQPPLPVSPPSPIQIETTNIENPKRKKQQKKNKKRSFHKQTIAESKQQQLSSDSDDIYYKRNRNFSKKKLQKQYPQQQRYDTVRKNSFNASNDREYYRPLYSPEQDKRYGNYKQDMKDNHRNFNEPDLKESRSSNKIKINKEIIDRNKSSASLSANVKRQTKLTLAPQTNIQISLQPTYIDRTPTKPFQPPQNKQKTPQNIFLSQSAVVSAPEKNQHKIQISRIDMLKQQSFYNKLQEEEPKQYIVNNKLANFFKPKKSQQLLQVKTISKNNTHSFSQYIEDINESLAKNVMELQKEQKQYLSENNYSSVLGQMHQGQVPQQVQPTTKKQQQLARSNNSSKHQKAQLIDLIRQKYL